jgi:hypothetical protein
MNGKSKRVVSPLAKAEMEVLQEGREWMRRRLEKKLQKAAEAEGGFSPLEREASCSQAPTSHGPDDERRES